MSIVTAIQKIKANTSRFLGKGFAWQDGYGVFTVGASQVDAVKQYIGNQQDHHAKYSYDDEFRLLMQKYASHAVP